MRALALRSKLPRSPDVCMSHEHAATLLLRRHAAPRHVPSWHRGQAPRRTRPPRPPPSLRPRPTPGGCPDRRRRRSRGAASRSPTSARAPCGQWGDARADRRRAQRRELRGRGRDGERRPVRARSRRRSRTGDGRRPRRGRRACHRGGHWQRPADAGDPPVRARRAVMVAVKGGAGRAARAPRRARHAGRPLPHVHRHRPLSS
jgi:hypothetical protein